MYRLPNCPPRILWSDIISELQYNTKISVGSNSTRNTVFDLMLNIATQSDGELFYWHGTSLANR